MMRILLCGLACLVATSGCGELFIPDPDGAALNDSGDDDGDSGVSKNLDSGKVEFDGSVGSSRDAVADSNSQSEVDAVAPDDGGDAGCLEGASRCVFNGLQSCSGGNWGTVYPCPSSTPQCVHAVCQAPPSCQTAANGTNNCGAGDNGGESCCVSPEVPGGTYDRTYGSADAGDPATVSGFRFDKYLVTVGRFRQFVNAVLPADGGTGWLPAAGSGKHVHLNGGAGLATAPNVDAGQTYESGWTGAMTDNAAIQPTAANLGANCLDNIHATWTASSGGGHESFPVNCVTWQEAYAFCIWDGGFLPSEAEWEYAAAGGNQQREYPWGSTDPGSENQYAIYGLYYTADPTYIAPVGFASMGGADWAQLDMTGEVSEWTLDWYDSSYASPCVDCVQESLGPTGQRSTRGGNCNSDTFNLLVTARTIGVPTQRVAFNGFRCARTP